MFAVTMYSVRELACASHHRFRRVDRRRHDLFGTTSLPWLLTNPCLLTTLREIGLLMLCGWKHCRGVRHRCTYMRDNEVLSWNGVVIGGNDTVFTRL